MGRDALVLDVGSGGSPSPFADVLADKYFGGSAHRCGRGLKIDRRPLVLTDGCRLPFRDKEFDFVICSHVLEHIPEPRPFLEELGRVGKAGYIETPSVIFERLIPYDIHCLEVSVGAEGLVIAKKPRSAHDQIMSSVLDGPAHAPWRRLLAAQPELFHVRFYWQDRVPFHILNEGVDASWISNVTPDGPPPADRSPTSWRERLYRSSVDMAHAGFAILRGRWGRRIELDSLLVCPTCKGPLIQGEAAGYRCERCGTSFESEPLPILIAP